MTPPPGERPRVRTVLEPVTPERGSFDPGAMARGVPGVPRRFAWRGRTYVVAEVLDTQRESENYTGAPRDTYAKRHVVRVRTETGEVMVLSASRGALGHATRWILREIEGEDPGPPAPGPSAPAGGT